MKLLLFTTLIFFLFSQTFMHAQSVVKNKNAEKLSKLKDTKGLVAL